MPKLWSETIEEHRREVHDAILDTTAALAARHGLRSVTMSQIAEKTGIGRATLYKYFPDVDTILLTWHARQVSHHLEHLGRVRDQKKDPGERLEAVLEAYALIIRQSRGHGDTDLASFLHGAHQVAQAERRLQHMLRDLVSDAARSGAIRSDVSPEVLADYCLSAANAASSVSSKTSVRRLVAVILDGLRTSSGPGV